MFLHYVFSFLEQLLYRCLNWYKQHSTLNYIYYIYILRLHLPEQYFTYFTLHANLHYTLTNYIVALPLDWNVWNSLERKFPICGHTWHSKTCFTLLVITIFTRNAPIRILINSYCVQLILMLDNDKNIASK